MKRELSNYQLVRPGVYEDKTDYSNYKVDDARMQEIAESVSKGEQSQHIVRPATEEELKEDCCGDRYECNIKFVCSCGKRACDSCMKSHILKLHMRGQLGMFDGA
jgi:hypothetical protein